MEQAPEKDRAEKMKKQKEALAARLSRIKRIILVLSGKGGVGKSTVAANLAVALSMQNKNVGLLDIDIHGPSIPGILGLEGKAMSSDGQAIRAVEYAPHLKVTSIGFMLGDRDAAVIWRGPLKHQVIRQFISDVEWGDLDYLVVDSPPGTGDEPLSIAQLLQMGTSETETDRSGAVIVTTPQNVSVNDVRRCVTFCRQVKMPILGVIENMSGFVCPHCGEKVDIFKTGGGEKMAKEMDIPFLGKIPLAPGIVEACENGKPFVSENPDASSAKAFLKISSSLTS